MTDTFDDIRPYNDAEMKEAIARITNSPVFASVAEYVYPNVPLNEVRQRLCSIATVNELQNTVMVDIIQSIIRQSITELTYEGAEQLDPAGTYLFISNHRDIVLDAYLLQYVLWKHKCPVYQITFGANLMQNPLVNDVGRCNKMFRVERGGSPREFYRAMSRTSQYIRHTITELHESIWIAQRNGRTKNGIDQTEVALVKMLGMSGGKDFVRAYDCLHIMPISISYEWEPCDLLKALELCRTRHGHYTKAPEEDLISIITGIRSQKGHVHITLNKAISSEDLTSISSGKDFHEELTELIDKRILGGYRLTANNYIAHDIINESTKNRDHYTDDQRNRFEQHIQQLTASAQTDISSRLRTTLLNIYANPVDHCTISL